MTARQWCQFSFWPMPPISFTAQEFFNISASVPDSWSLSVAFNPPQTLKTFSEWGYFPYPSFFIQFLKEVCNCALHSSCFPCRLSVSSAFTHQRSFIAQQSNHSYGDVCCLSLLYLQAFARNLFNWLLWQMHTRTHADVHTQIHARTFYANPQQQEQLWEPFITSRFSLQLHRTKYGQLHAKMVGHLLCTDLSEHLINASQMSRRNRFSIQSPMCFSYGKGV